MIPGDMLHHITKYECFLLHGILVVEFRSCYIFKNFTVPPKRFNTDSYARSSLSKVTITNKL
jgi:hypothetical protein